MGTFKKFLHHVDIEDVKQKHLEEVAVKKLKEERQKEEKEFIVNTMKEIKYDWRSSLHEKMSTGSAFAYTAAGQPDADVATIDASLETSFGHDQKGVEAHGYSSSGLMGGVAIKPSGSGTGSNGGFDIGDHLAFTGDGMYNVRWAALTPVDSSAIDTLTITAIRGNDSNGGEDPDASGEDLEVWYRNADMGQNMWTPINQDPAGNTISGVEKIIIPIGSDSSGLRDWTLPIPAHARTTSTQFMLFQGTSSGAQYDHYGVTKISFKRNAPVNVVVSLDDPAASAFIRVGGPAGEKSDPKKRKKKVQDMLDASDEYVTKTMGDNFPGTGVSLDPIEASPVGKDQVAKSFEKAGTPQKTIQNFLQTDDITGEPIEKKIEKSFSQFKPEVTPEGKPAPDPIPVNGNKNVVFGSDAQAMMSIDDETREKLKEKGLKDKDIQRVLDAGGAEDLKAVASGDVYAGLMSDTFVIAADYKNLKHWEQDILQQGLKNTPAGSSWEMELKRLKQMYPGFYPRADAGSSYSVAGTGGSPGQPYTPPKEDPNNPYVPAPGKDTKLAELPPEEQIAQAEKEAELTDDEKEELKNQGKTEEEIKQEEQNKKDQAKLDALTDEIIRRNDYVAHDVAGMNEILSNVTWLVGVFNDHLNPISWIVKAFGGEVNSGKLINNLTIARSIFTGRVENHIPLTREITNFTNYLTPDIFQSSHFNYVPISDTRHPYADDNIKVSLNGEVSINDGSHQSLATKAYPSLGDSGNGYAQLIIPPDGGRPYVHYYDHNYHNLNSPNPGEVPNKIQEQLSALVHKLGEMGPIKSLLTIPFIDAVIQSFNNYNEVFESLKDKPGMPGWPPGIHGSALTDFKVDIKNLPQETQDMINAHPLSWTEERISTMTEDQLVDQLISALDSDENWVKNNMDEILEKNHPELAKLQDQVVEAYNKKSNITDQPEYSAAGDAAKEYVETVKENYKELIDNVEKEIPLPEGDYPKWDEKNDPDMKANKEAVAKAWDVYQDTWSKAEPAMEAYSAYAATLEKRGKYLYGTFDEIEKLKRLEKEQNDALAPWNKASDAWDALLEQQKKLSTAYYNKLIKERKPWDDVYDKQREAKDKLYAERDEKVEAAQKAYEDTYSVRKGQGGKLLNGGDWTHPETGEVIPGMDTVKNNIQKEIDDLNDLITPLYQAYFGDVVYEYKGWYWKTNYKGHGDGKSWTPSGGYSTAGAGGSPGQPYTPPKEDPNNPYVPAPGRNKFRVARSQLSVDDPVFKDDDYASYRLSGRNLFEKLKSSRYNDRHPVVDIKKIKKKYDYANKPSPDGFPENEPPQLDPKTGMHPRYGKNANRYGKLDPISAKAMARVKTGDPETDASVQKQAKKTK